jgi:hypothetical protein
MEPDGQISEISESGYALLKMMNLIKVMNFSGAGEIINFTFTRRGREGRPSPPGPPPRGYPAPRSGERGKRRWIGGALAVRALGGGLLAQLTGRFTQERNRSRVSSRTEGDDAGVI